MWVIAFSLTIDARVYISLSLGYLGSEIAISFDTRRIAVIHSTLINMLDVLHNSALIDQRLHWMRSSESGGSDLNASELCTSANSRENLIH